MPIVTSLKRSSGGATAAPPEQSRSVSTRLMKSVAKKLEGKKKKIGLYVKGGGGGCRVGACDELEAEECLPRRALAAPDRCSRKYSGKMRREQPPPTISSTTAQSLPDDVLELILVRLPLAALMAARCVCRQWRCMTAKPHFRQLRTEAPYLTPWLFLFRCNTGEVQALDVSLCRWHRTSIDMLKGRSLFSTASIGTDIYIIGGCSSELDSISSVVFSPFTGVWRNAAPMKSPRSTPVLGVSEVPVDWSILCRAPDRREQIKLKSRIGAVSDVYEDPHRFSLRRRQLLDAENSVMSMSRPSKPAGQERGSERKFVLVAVGGRGDRDEPLDTGEIYDPTTDRWSDIARLPGDFGPVCSGAVCDGVFYVYTEGDRLAGYNVERGFWITIQVLRPPPCVRGYYPKIVCCKGRLFLLCVSWAERGGHLNRGDNAVRKLWELDLALCEWKEVSRHPDAPMDWNAAFVADKDMIYGVEMFRIFGQVLDFLTACNVTDHKFEWMHVSRKNATHVVDASSSAMKSMVVVHL